LLKTLPGSSGKALSDITPVFLLQANFITGGLLLTFVGQHNTMDMTGQGHVIHLFSKACCNEQSTSEELSSGNQTRRNIIPLLGDSYQQGLELAHQMVPTTTSQYIASGTDGPPAPLTSLDCTWAYFLLNSTSLTALKSLAEESVILPNSYISTDDALSAFIWQSVIRARLP